MTNTKLWILRFPYIVAPMDSIWLHLPFNCVLESAPIRHKKRSPSHILELLESLIRDQQSLIHLLPSLYLIILYIPSLCLSDSDDDVHPSVLLELSWFYREGRGVASRRREWNQHWAPSWKVCIRLIEKRAIVFCLQCSTRQQWCFEFREEFWGYRKEEKRKQ